ncbi:JmjC domain, hydroxylase-domain-containing protein [Geopyxis carbonaria]|nr:JmjC domain, hydroxylase-domain-containing protein [Geopyxis carbonaria]
MNVSEAPITVAIKTSGTGQEPKHLPLRSPNFQVVVEKQINDVEQLEIPSSGEHDEIEEEITPAYYYENSGIPVFTPSMDQFRSFKKFVDNINHYGMKSGIVKIIPPKEWTDSLPPLDDKVRDIRIKNPIEQDIAGSSGEYRQTNIEKQRTYNLPQWRQLCEGADHQPPARRGERRRGTTRPAPKRATRSRKNIDLKDDEEVLVKIEDTEEAIHSKPNPPTPKSPEKPTTDDGDIQKDCIGGSLLQGSLENTPDGPAGRQPRKKRVYKSAKERAADREMADEEAYEGFDYRICDADHYTPERCEELEKAYWRTLTYNSPLYGADMPGSLFDESTTSWNVAKLENLLDCLGKKLPGVNTAYLYLGMWKSTFAWHLEDMDLYSINYIHFGAPKQWYSISRADKSKFEQLMKSIWPNDAKKCSQFLRHKTFLVSPSLLATHGIKANKVVHHQGEFVITFPFGYHSGYNLGYNCAESVNFATNSWLQYGRNAKKCDCVGDSVFVDVEEIERKLRGELTEDDDSEEDYDYYDEDEDEAGIGIVGDFPTPPESVEGKPAKVRRPRKRKVDNDMQFGRETKVKRIKIKVPKAPAHEPCVLCPNDPAYESLLPTENGFQAHRLCAIYTPETYFKWDEFGREIVANIDDIPKARLDLRCFFCRGTKGSCFQCTEKKCTRAYHATCSAAAGVLVNMVEVSITDDEGNNHPQTNIDFKCRFHRPKRHKDLDTEQLEDDPLIRAYASTLITQDVIQMQYLGRDIFAGLVVENRPNEGTVLVQTMPKDEILEVPWIYILAQDPSKTDFPDAITTAPLFPQLDYRPMGRAQPPRNDLPQPDEHFGMGLIWGGLILENIDVSPDQVPISDKDSWWHYLGELSTESIAKYSRNPSSRMPDESANFISQKNKPKTRKAPSIIKSEVGYPMLSRPTVEYGQPGQYMMGTFQRPNGYGPGYRPQFHGGSTAIYAPLNTPSISGFSSTVENASIESLSPDSTTHYPRNHATDESHYHSHGHPVIQFMSSERPAVQPREFSRVASSIMQVTQSTPIPSPITPITTQIVDSPSPIRVVAQPEFCPDIQSKAEDIQPFRNSYTEYKSYQRLPESSRTSAAPVADITAALSKLASARAAASSLSEASQQTQLLPSCIPHA